jgi:hypothetical protein
MIGSNKYLKCSRSGSCSINSDCIIFEYIIELFYGTRKVQ